MMKYKSSILLKRFRLPVGMTCMSLIGVILLLMVVSSGSSVNATFVPSSEVKLTASDANADDKFGNAVSLDSETLIVGTASRDAAYIFQQSAGIWTEQAKLTPSDGGDGFGSAVSISGDVAVVGAPSEGTHPGIGAAYVFRRNGAVWNEEAKLVASDRYNGQQLGISVAIDGDTIVVGTMQDDDKALDAGAVYYFQRSGGTWSQQAKLTADDAAQSASFGRSMALSRDTLAVGAPGHDGAADCGSLSFNCNSGAVYIFLRDATGQWNQHSKLIADGSTTTAKFGESISLSNETLVVGAFQSDDASFCDPLDLLCDSGSAFVFVRDASDQWNEQAKLIPNDVAEKDFFGNAVGVSGDIAIVAAILDDGPPGAGQSASGSAYIFFRTNGVWHEESKLTASDASAVAAFGSSVVIVDSTVIVGARTDDAVGTDSGSAYVYELVSDDLPPETSIVQAVDGNNNDVVNDGETVSSSIVLTFTASDNVAVVDFECSLNASFFASCSSPTNYSDLATGAHTFEVRAIDSAGNVDLSPAVFTWTVITPQESLESLKGDVQNLVVAGVLNEGQGNSLSKKLDLAIEKIEGGNIVPACAKLSDFISQVSNLVQNGTLSPAQGQPLIDSATDVMSQVGC